MSFLISCYFHILMSIAFCHHAKATAFLSYTSTRKTLTTSRSTNSRLDIRLIRGTTNLFPSITWPTRNVMSSSLSLSAEISTLPGESLAFLSLPQSEAETIAGPFFGLSLLPYLAFLYFLNTPVVGTPKGVTVGFATCLLFVFLTIPAAIAAQLLYGVSLADSDWLHGSAESLLTITNLVTVIGFRQALASRKKNDNMSCTQLQHKNDENQTRVSEEKQQSVVASKNVTSYIPMTFLVLALTFVALLTAFIPFFMGAEVHTPYLGGFLDLPKNVFTSIGGRVEPTNALTVGCWIIHISSLVEFLVAMGFVWRWADLVGNQKWKGLTWGLLPLHTSGIIACTYHLFYNHLPILVVLQAITTLIGNSTAAYAAYRIALSAGWSSPIPQLSFLNKKKDDQEGATEVEIDPSNEGGSSLIRFEDLGQMLSGDSDSLFLIQLFLGCTVASYFVKYGELFFNFPFDNNLSVALSFIIIPSSLNAYKWCKRSKEPTFDGWF